VKNLLKISDEVINKRLQTEFLSRLFGNPLYKQKKENIRFEELEDIQDELLAKGIFSQIEESPKYYYLKILPNVKPQKKQRYLWHLFLFL